MYVWRAVDDEGEVLDSLLYRHRDGWTCIKFLMRLLTTQPIWPEKITTDGHPAYAHALKILGFDHLHAPVRRRANNRVENSHLPIRRRERKMMGFKSILATQEFLTSHAAVYNTFTTGRHMTSRRTLKLLRGRAFEDWTLATAT